MSELFSNVRLRTSHLKSYSFGRHEASLAPPAAHPSFLEVRRDISPYELTEVPQKVFQVEIIRTQMYHGVETGMNTCAEPWATNRGSAVRVTGQVRGAGTSSGDRTTLISSQWST